MNSSFNPADIQSILYTGYATLEVSSFFVIQLKENAISNFKTWLSDNINFIETLDKERPVEFAMNIAFTASGLKKLGLDQNSIESFSIPFQQGMDHDDRSKILKDEGESSSQHWDWGSRKNYVDVLLLCYGASPIILEEQINRLNLKEEWFTLFLDVDMTGSQSTKCIEKLKNFGREHFGFMDGLTDVTSEGFVDYYQKRKQAKGESPKKAFHPWDVLKDGEFLLGHPNEYSEVADSPYVKKDPHKILPPHPLTGFDIGKNGSYLVFRQLEQHVADFWKFIEKQTMIIDQSKYSKEYLAAKILGRFPDGRIFNGDEKKQISFVESNDKEGLKCPYSAHIRRANPRDTFVEDAKESIAIVRKHRIIRRGRRYGPPVCASENIEDIITASLNAGAEEKCKRGLNFICFNSNIANQFEFIQQNWLNNPKFSGLYNDPDIIATNHPLNNKTFSIPDEPFRKRLCLENTFLKVVGGAYFFLPSKNALKFLSLV